MDRQNMERIELHNDYDEKAFEIGKTIHNHTIQLLKAGGGYDYLPHGTGVLVKAHSEYLLLTASHVTKIINDTTHLFVNLQNKVVPVSGMLRETDLSKDRLTDLAYIILDNKLGEQLSKDYTFLPINMIDETHKNVPTIQYLFVGYPLKNIKIDGKKITTGTTAYLTSIAEQQIYDNMGLDSKDNFILNFDKVGIDSETQKSIPVSDPFGVSGCGLWFIRPYDINGHIEYTYSLIGIIKGGTKYHLIATNIRILLDGLKNLNGIKSS